MHYRLHLYLKQILIKEQEELVELDLVSVTGCTQILYLEMIY
jgi:hypothetical protein